MPNSCFGCCSLRHGVSCIYIFNIFFITFVIMSDFLHRLSNYHLLYFEHTSFENTTLQTLNPNLYPDEDTLLHFNSTANDFYQPKKITPILSEIFMDYIFIVKLGWNVMEFYLNISLKESTYSGFVEIAFLVVEIYFVQLYYKQQKLTAVNDFFQLKWKYLPKSKKPSDQNKSAIIIISDNSLEQTQDQSDYIPIFVKELRHANS
ncbi:uncharacterized protein LOC112595996 isoform X2 [Melanaphis sacchari]|uniref:uncharacterized protein LOC112595996 isoform X2 n=1 Tax=Melanaphis sacchari TaxID=742174 RepID=UPI000DC14A5B|nr:uncharacterized protein LOC112595996 isoform X2 [Melanaphis sacchari]